MILYTAQCRECATKDPFMYESEAERDSEAKAHMEVTGHTLAVGYLDTNEAPPYTCPRCNTFYESGYGAEEQFKRDHNERVCAYGF